MELRIFLSWERARKGTLQWEAAGTAILIDGADNDSPTLGFMSRLCYDGLSQCELCLCGDQQEEGKELAHVAEPTL